MRPGDGGESGFVGDAVQSHVSQASAAGPALWSLHICSLVVLEFTQRVSFAPALLKSTI